MVENLRLGDSKLQNRTLTSANTDITASTYQLPAQTDVNFDAKGNYEADALYIDPNHPEYGGYYSWHTATAGTGTASMSTDGQNATSSIYPKGWRLPTSGSGGDFENMAKKYGSGTDQATNTALMVTPVPGFLLGGFVWNTSDGVTGQGSLGSYWSSTVAYNTRNAYYLRLTGSSVAPSFDYYRYIGAPVRCIADEPEPSPELLTQLYISSTDTVTVKPGKGINLIMIADGNDKWKPYYATQDTPVTLPSASGRKYVLTVVPSPGNVMTNLTKEADGTITATGAKGSYPSMQDFNSCTANGANVTDSRNKVSYTVAKIGGKCWMLSNLRLAAGTTLTNTDSNVSSDFILPTTTWDSTSQNSSTSAIMKECYGTVGDISDNNCSAQSTTITEYYYNWPAAKAETDSVTSNGYSICPKNWTLPSYSYDITGDNAFNSTLNPGRLATVGNIISGSQKYVGNEADWQSSTELKSSHAFYLVFSGNAAYRSSDDGFGVYGKVVGLSVRCMR